MISYILFLLFFSIRARCNIVEYNWSIDWVDAAPDGFSRPVIGVNGKWPPPTVEADLGDTVVVHVHNNLKNETTGIHWHGQFQSGTGTMDGASSVHQCPIPPDGDFTYKFTAGPAGTYWYHSHNKGQYPDGLRGPLIVHDRKAEAALKYDTEYTVTLSDWYHEQMPKLINYYLGNSNTDGAEPIPDAGLINDKMNETLKIYPGKSYLFRFVSMSALASHVVTFDDHVMTIIAVDGVSVRPQQADQIVLTAAQRYDVLIQAKRNPTRNYAFVARFVDDMFDSVPPTLNMHMDGVLQYSPNYAPPPPIRLDSNQLKPYDDFNLVPLDGMPLLKNPDQTIELAVNFSTFSVGQRAALGNMPYVPAKVPTLYTALTTGRDAFNPVVYGATTNPYIVENGQIIQIVITNYDEGNHPFHLHGHNFQVVHRDNSSQVWDRKETGFPAIPMRRDTVFTPGLGNLVIRYKADNPGVHLFHCHIEWHVEAGLTVTLIESPDLLQRSLQIPDDHIRACRKQGIPTKGNCAGEVANVLNVKKCPQPFVFESNPQGALV